jgi:exonuclease I
LLARFGTTAAGISTSLHLGIITEPRAVLCALRADLGTDPTGSFVKRGNPQHEILTCLTDLGTVKQQSDVTLLRMRAPFL